MSQRVEAMARQLVDEGECAAGMAWCPGGDLCDHTDGSRCSPGTEAVLDEIYEDAAWEAAVDDAIMDAITCGDG